MKQENQKSLKKSTLFFLLNPVPFNALSYQKQKGPGTSNQLLFRLWNKFRRIPLLVIYYLTKFDVIPKTTSAVIPKTTSANLSKPIHYIINYCFSICPFVSGKCGKAGKNLQKFQYLKNEKSFLDEIENAFHSFWRAIIWSKNKNLIKIADTSFNYFWLYQLKIMSRNK